MASLKENLHKIIVELRKIRKSLRNDGNSNLPLELYSELIDNIIQEKNKNNNSKQLLNALIDRTITNFDIPDDITFIGRYTFDGCQNLKYITLHSNITRIEEYAFKGCYALDNIIIPNSVTIIKPDAFYGCSAFTEIIIPNSVTNIGKEVFRDCSNLSNITIPSSITSISESVFLNCTKLENVIVDDGFNANGLNLSSSTLYSVETMVAILNALADRSGELEQYTLTLGVTNLNKLTEEQKDIARNKNWILN